MSLQSRDSYIVTGAGGFIGARFVEAVRRAGARLISVDRKSGPASTFERPEHRGLDFGETLDIEELDGFLAGPEAPKDLTAIIHLGACTDTMELDEAVHERRSRTAALGRRRAGWAHGRSRNDAISPSMTPGNDAMEAKK